MKVKLNDLVKSSDALVRIGQEKANGKLTYQIGRNIRLIEPELIAYNDKRNKLLEEYATLNEDRTRWTFNNGNAEKFNVEISQMLDSEIELNLYMLTMDDISNFNASSIDMMLIDWMISS